MAAFKDMGCCPSLIEEEQMTDVVGMISTLDSMAALCGAMCR